MSSIWQVELCSFARNFLALPTVPFAGIRTLNNTTLFN